MSSLTQKLGNSPLVTYEYEYDEDGNISEIYESNGNGNAVLSDEYYYDSLNELEIINDRKNGIYTHYTYDKAGNVTEILKRNYDNNGVPSSLISQDTFEYEQNGWNDRLTKFNNDKISYDLNGNPLKYRDGMSFTWVNGRRLKTILYNGNTYVMSYDNNGMRTQKGNTHYYYDSGNNLVGMTKNNKTLFFYYDESGAPTSFSYNGLMHYYIKNLQGDIMKIVNSQGENVASYAYDVSGKLMYIKNYYNALVTDPNHIGMLNPLRYRGYVYDDETGLYYLQSRYYDPVTTRFINADVYCDTDSGSPLSTNMFAYCENCAIFSSDLRGYWASKTHIKITNDKGFSSKEYSLVRDWSYKADLYPCESTSNYSAPFHGRKDGLDIGRKLYNLACQMRKSKKKATFYWSDSEAKKHNGKSIDFLSYDTKDGKDAKKTKKAMNDFRKILNQAGNAKDQSHILLGLALHTLQDYFAHVVMAKLTKYETKYDWVKKTTTITGYGNMYMYKVDDTMGLPNSAIEDNTSVFSWRYEMARRLTKSIFVHFWSKNKEMSKLWVTESKEYDKYRKVTFNSGIYKVEWKIECKKLDYHWKY